MKKRGYSIIEAAIVLTAFMLLVGAMAWPVAQRIRLDQDTSERAYMESMKDAVIAYAMRSRTPGAVVDAVFTRGAVGVTRITLQVNVPAGRPYLPCPDIDADGLEDRATGKATGVMTLTALYVEPQTLAMDIDESGNCVADKGLFPWRTLGTKPADYWGQHYDYYVHRMLANPLLGFDQYSASAGYLTLLAVSVKSEECTQGDWLPSNSGVGYVRGERVSEGALGYVALEDPDHFAPLVIARSNYSGPTVVLEAAESNTAFDANFLQDRRRLADGSGEHVEVIRNCWLPRNSFPPRRSFGYSGGVAFAIVSHGRNGYGGVKYEPTENARTLVADDCKRFPAISNRYLFEIYNGNCLPLRHATNNLVANPNFMLNAHVLVSGIASPGADDNVNHEFDDLVVWMMPRQLFNDLAQKDALPRPPAIKIAEF